MWLINRKEHAVPVKRYSTPMSMTATQLFAVSTALRLLATPSMLRNERGIALITALILALVGMLMTASLLYMAGTGIWTSGSKVRYQTALGSSHGGLNFFAKEIIQRGVGGTTLSGMGNYGGGVFTLTPLATDANFTAKLTTTGSLGVGGYPATNPDATLTLTFEAPTPNMIVSTTILSTSRGNSGTSSNVLVGGGVVSNNSGTITPQHIPYLYQTEIQAQNATNPIENARLSAIYAY